MKIDITKDRRLAADIPPGEYDFTIAKEVEETNYYDTPGIKLLLKIEKNGAYIGYISQLISSTKEGDVKDLCSAVGLSVDQSGEVPVNRLAGLSGKCVVKEKKTMIAGTFIASGSNSQVDSFAPSSDIPF